MNISGQYWGKGKDIRWEPPTNATTADLRLLIFGPDLTRRVVAFCMGIAICHWQKFGQVWGLQLPYQKS